MSSTATVPPPNSSSLAHAAPRLTERARALLTAMNLHFAGVAALVVLTLWLLIHLIVVWGALQSHDANAMADQHTKLTAAEIAALPLKGLDEKVAKSTRQADGFYADRLPYAYSGVVAELGVLTQHAGVRLPRVQYNQLMVPGLTKGNALTEVRMDANVSGDYRPVVQFLSSLERDPMFFLIGGINLTGQQTGQVNLRIRLTTFLRPANADEMTHELAVPGTDANAKQTKAAAGGAQ
jgi:type IV pilus assembly protein PilO